MQVIGLHQNRSAHASKVTRFRVTYQHVLVSLPPCAGKLLCNLVSLHVNVGKLWMNKFTRLCGSVLLQVTSFLFLSAVIVSQPSNTYKTMT